MLIEDFKSEYDKYHVMGTTALTQVSDAALNIVPFDDGNSIAMIVRHVSGNFASRFTDFLTTDGAKQWRDRDDEFAERAFSRADVDRMWRDGWAVLDQQLSALTDSDLQSTVTIRGQSLTVHAALTRSLAHVASHVGQIVFLARIHAGKHWKSLSIPRGESAAFNQRLASEPKSK
jgi:hypothetical protein